MKKEDMCPYSNEKGIKPGDPMHTFYSKEEIVNKKVQCPVCGRKMMARIRMCNTGCCIYYCIPPHKKKKWWKKGKKKSRDNSIRRR